MGYKEICNKNINKLSIELLNNGMSMHDVSNMTLEIYEVIKKHLGETKMHQVTCMHDRDEQCFGDCPGCARAEINRLEELEEENND